MALPHTSITPIPSNEPDAVPALWNTRYAEIDANFVNLDGRAVAAENEIVAARGGQLSIDARLDLVEANVSGTSVDMQNMVGGALKYALAQVGVANKSIAALKNVNQQEGVITFLNYGVISGCVLTKNATNDRSMSLALGYCFLDGRKFYAPANPSTISVPGNSGGSSAVVYAYLYLNAGIPSVGVTDIGGAIPAGTVKLYSITIPAGNTVANDANLTSVTLTDVRRIEPLYPMALDAPISISVSINTLSDVDYQLTFDVISYEGPPVNETHVIVSSRATNGFTVQLISAADNVVVRWKLSKLNN